MPDAPASGAFGLARKIAATIGLVGFAVAALLSGSDRQSRDFPNSPSLVGWPYDTGAARAKAALAFVRIGPASAIGYARRAIVSDPISAQAVSLLGRAHLFSQHLPEAQRAFQVSGQLGWRDAMTQIYWLDQAMQDGDIKIASERLDALLRQSPDDENRDRFLAFVAASPEGRSALAQRLRTAPAWSKPYVADLADLPREQLLQRVDVMTRTGGGVWDCREVAPMAQKLIDLNMFPEAVSIWRRFCPTSNSLLYDSGFESLDTTRSTRGFDWQLSGRGDVDVQPVTDGSGNRRIGFEVTAARSLPILRQLVVLEPGTYQLAWRSPDTEAAAARQLSVSLACNPSLADAVTGVPAPGSKDGYLANFTIDKACSARQLTFWLPPRVHLFIDDVALRKK